MRNCPKTNCCLSSTTITSPTKRQKPRTSTAATRLPGCGACGALETDNVVHWSIFNLTMKRRILRFYSWYFFLWTHSSYCLVESELNCFMIIISPRYDADQRSEWSEPFVAEMLNCSPPLVAVTSGQPASLPFPLPLLCLACLCRAFFFLLFLKINTLLSFMWFCMDHNRLRCNS